MKFFVFILAMLAAQQYCYAQETAIDKYYKSFQQQHTLSVASLSSSMLPLLIEDKKGKEKEELQAILSKLRGLKILTKTNPANGNELFASANSLIPKLYESVFSITEPDRKVKCYTLTDHRGTITELVMIAWQWDRFMLLSITGDVDLKGIYRLIQVLDFSGANRRVQGK